MPVLTTMCGRSLAMVAVMAVGCVDALAREPARDDYFVVRMCQNSDPAGPVSDWDALFDCIASLGSRADGVDPFQLIERMLRLRHADVPPDVSRYWRAQIAFARQDDAQYLQLLRASAEAGHAEAAFELYMATGEQALLQAAIDGGSHRAREIRVQTMISDDDPAVVERGIASLEELAGEGSVQAIDQLARHVDRLPDSRRSFWRLAFFLGNVNTGDPFIPPSDREWRAICAVSRDFPRVLAAAPLPANMSSQQKVVAVEYLVQCGAPLAGER